MVSVDLQEDFVQDRSFAAAGTTHQGLNVAFNFVTNEHDNSAPLLLTEIFGVEATALFQFCQLMFTNLRHIKTIIKTNSIIFSSANRSK